MTEATIKLRGKTRTINFVVTTERKLSVANRRAKGRGNERNNK